METPEKKEKETLQQKANNLMIESGVKEIYRTSDNFWFTSKESADRRAKKMSKTTQVFTLNKE